jgi:hypothetical protein
MPQLKVYQSKEARDSWVPRGALALFGERHSQQGTWFIVAHTAIEAVQIADAAGISYADSPRKLRVGGHGNDFHTLVGHGFLTTPGEVIATTQAANGPVARFLDGAWSLIGRFEYDHATRETVFTPEEA